MLFPKVRASPGSGLVFGIRVLTECDGKRHTSKGGSAVPGPARSKLAYEDYPAETHSSAIAGAHVASCGNGAAHPCNSGRFGWPQKDLGESARRQQDARNTMREAETSGGRSFQSWKETATNRTLEERHDR